MFQVKSKLSNSCTNIKITDYSISVASRRLFSLRGKQCNSDHALYSNFSECLCLSKKLRENITQKLKLTKPTFIQAEITKKLPIRSDLIIKSKTGSGKTLAYLMACLDVMDRSLSSEEQRKGKQVSTMILAPTRELALQIAAQTKLTIKGLGYEALTFIGGEYNSLDLKRINSNRVDFIIGTPKRIIDLAKVSEIFRHQLQGLKTLVLDEADELLINNKETCERVLKLVEYLPRTKQTILVSATIDSTKNMEIFNEIFGEEVNRNKLIHISSNEEKTESSSHEIPEKIKQKYCIIPWKLQLHFLYSLLKKNKEKKCILFLQTKAAVELFKDYVDAMKVFKTTYSLHSKVDRNSRVAIFNKFAYEQKSSILICTDLMSRGIDFKHLEVVIQLGCPISVDSYIHRIGRVGREEKYGESYLILSPFEEHFIKRLTDENGININRINISATVEKPEPEEIHAVNKIFDRMTLFQINQFFSSTFKYYKTIHRLLEMTPRMAYLQAKRYVVGMGYLPPHQQKTEDPKTKSELERINSIITNMKK